MREGCSPLRNPISPHLTTSLEDPRPSTSAMALEELDSPRRHGKPASQKLFHWGPPDRPNALEIYALPILPYQMQRSLLTQFKVNVEQ